MPICFRLFVHCVRRDDSRAARGAHGLTRKLVANMVTGVSTGFRRVLEINGVGYRAEVAGQKLPMVALLKEEDGSKVFGCWTGSSLGWAPRRIRST